MGEGPLAEDVARGVLEHAGLDVLLGVVPGAATVVEDGGEDHAGHRADHEQGCFGLRLQEHADDDRRDDGDHPRRDHVLERRLRGQVDDASVVGARGAGHDAGVLAELTTDLLDDRARGLADSADRERRKEVHEHRADEATDEHVDLGEVDGVERLARDLRDLVEVRGKE